MLTISTADLERDFDRYVGAPSREPVRVIDDAGDLVMVPFAEFCRLKRLNGEAVSIRDAGEVGQV